MTDKPLQPGDWADVLPEHDIPPLLRNGIPTRGRVESVEDGVAIIHVPIGGADVDEHSQAVPYPVGGLVRADGPPAP